MEKTVRNICAVATALPAEPPARIELIPVGAFKTADRRPQFRIDDAAAVIAASLEQAPGGVLPIDFDHRSFASSGTADSRAAGWITGLEVEGDRVMASVEWTEDGQKAVSGRVYRFISPVFKNLPDGQVVLIEGAGLVNTPALPQLRQLASKENSMDPIEEIAGLLGLAADKPADIVTRVTSLVAAETQLASITKAAKVDGPEAVTQICARLTKPVADPGEFVPKASFDELQTQFAALQTTVKNGAVEAALDRAREAGKLTPDLEPWATQLAAKDLSEFEAWAAVAPVRVNVSGQRQLAGRPAPVKTDALDETERQVASLMGIAEADFLATRNAAVKEH
ncbi:hypothetical protein JI664_22345 [Rhodobacter sp. NTK016B]|uniref:phage protease n=1 Tax=Rhodobacter sp. NTK016B TaxID=2759676 RepID=UPI001A8EFC5E|nr:phage protease [Rhodobacter sp. NTK016B]MBN8294727.1 hypothetical protein [Rhodobacter sp. NTK016B]